MGGCRWLRDPRFVVEERRVFLSFGADGLAQPSHSWSAKPTSPQTGGDPGLVNKKLMWSVTEGLEVEESWSLDAPSHALRSDADKCPHLVSFGAQDLGSSYRQATEQAIFL